MYWFVSLLLTFIVFSVSVLFSDFGLLKQVYLSHGFTSFIKLAFSMLTGAGFSLGVFSTSTILTTSMLFGINISLLVFYIKQQKKVLLSQTPGLSALGLLFGVIGLGCASCGSLIVFSLFSFVGAGAFLTVLPFNGAEFSILGILLLLASNYLVLKKISAPAVC